MARVLGHHWWVEWGNPYTEPPDGMERVQFEVCAPPGHGRMPEAVDKKLDELGGPGSGWSACCGAVLPPRRELPLASKQSIRRKRLWKRMQKYPLFAEQFYGKELAKKPDYYGVNRAEIGGAS